RWTCRESIVKHSRSTLTTTAWSLEELDRLASRSSIVPKDRKESFCAPSACRVQSIRERSEPNTKTAFCKSGFQNAASKSRRGSTSKSGSTDEHGLGNGSWIEKRTN